MGAALRCDSCGDFAPTAASTTRGAGPLQLPAGWIAVTVDPGQARADFCSADCAATWLMELGELAAGLEQADPSQFGQPPETWEPSTWAAFCRHHRVSQADALQHAQAEAKKVGRTVSKWAHVIGVAEVAEPARRFVLTHSRTLTAQAS